MNELSDEQRWREFQVALGSKIDVLLGALGSAGMIERLESMQNELAAMRALQTQYLLDVRALRDLLKMFEADPTIDFEHMASIIDGYLHGDVDTSVLRQMTWQNRKKRNRLTAEDREAGVPLKGTFTRREYAKAIGQDPRSVSYSIKALLDEGVIEVVEPIESATSPTKPKLYQRRA